QSPFSAWHHEANCNLLIFIMSFSFAFPYNADPGFQKKVAYFCMEFGIDQPLKTYAGGLGFLAGSHMRSAYELKQNMVGVGVLWKYGYYDQLRKEDQAMDVRFQEKIYGFLKKTDIKFTIKIYGHDVFVTAYYLPPDVFNTVPVFFLSTDIPENDYLAKTTCHKLYDSNPETRMAAAILLGEGGAKLLEKLNWLPDVYHLNESHALPLAFHLYKKFKKVEEVRKRLVFTNHTPEPGGNEKTNLSLLDKFGFFLNIPLNEVRDIACIDNGVLDHTLTALRLAGITNGVSRLHLQHLCNSWQHNQDICPLISITNAQSFSYWHDPYLYRALHDNNDAALLARKLELKRLLFEEVADQNGEIYDDKILTIVFAKRFGGYKRPELLLHNMDRFQRIVTNTERPVQVIWAGKPHPTDYTAIASFDRIVNICKTYTNCSVLVGYEMKLSKLLKQGADVWLNVPRITHEASGTSGMSAAMNGAVNVSIPDGWFPEFADDTINSFIIPHTDPRLPDHQQDEADATALYDLLENKVIPMYYDDPPGWLSIVKNGMKDIIPQFDSKRMAREYYEKLYLGSGGLQESKNMLSNVSEDADQRP
ncbi:MAG TPA: alpha-glucan family phosphorylase, partial [Agriterribacter sp.]|nr:alpha-glucan family phosphorylase [Agriterribacter sp.]